MSVNNQGCWFCETTDADDSYEVFLKKDESKSVVNVPSCSTCKSKHKKAIIGFLIIFFVVSLCGAGLHVAVLFLSNAELSGPGSAIGAALALLWCVPALILAFGWVSYCSKGIKPQRHTIKYPELMEKLNDGYLMVKPD